MIWILNDSSYLAHRALNAVGKLSVKEVPTGVLFGFMEQLATTCFDGRTQSNKVLIFADSKYSYRRKRFLRYKEKRRDDRTPEEKEKFHIMYEQVDILMEWLKYMGFVVLKQEGLESDDLIADAAIQLTERKEKGIMVTGDGDLYQCITPYISFWDPQRNKYFNQSSFKLDKGIDASQWGMVKAIGGCESDNVPGLSGVGSGGAIQYLNGELPEHYKKYQLITSPEGQKTIKRMAWLTVLPHEKTKPVKITEPDYDFNAFKEFCEEFEIATYMSGGKLEKWKRFFRGQMTPVKVKIRRRNRSGKRR